MLDQFGPPTPFNPFTKPRRYIHGNFQDAIDVVRGGASDVADAFQETAESGVNQVKQTASEVSDFFQGGAESAVDKTKAEAGRAEDRISAEAGRFQDTLEDAADDVGAFFQDGIDAFRGAACKLPIIGGLFCGGLSFVDKVIIAVVAVSAFGLIATIVTGRRKGK